MRTLAQWVPAFTITIAVLAYSGGSSDNSDGTSPTAGGSSTGLRLDDFAGFGRPLNIAPDITRVLPPKSGVPSHGTTGIGDVLSAVAETSGSMQFAVHPGAI